MLSQRHVYEIDRLFADILIVDGPGNAYDLNQRTVGAIEPDVLAYRIRFRPVVFREALIYDSHARRVCGIRLPKAAATQNRNSHRAEIVFINRIHRRVESFLITQHLKTVWDESNGVKAVLSEWYVLGESFTLHSWSFAHAFGQQPVELLRLSWTVLHQTWIEAGH